jgi:hypothetical protein
LLHLPHDDHCRFWAPERYCEAVVGGGIFKPLASKNFRGFTALFLGEKPLPAPDQFHPWPDCN